MAVESFMPITDVKQSVEKEVKERPKLSDLITVESPGKIGPGDKLEGEEKKKKIVRRRNPKVAPDRISSPERDSILIITEKPQAAQKIASSLGKEKKNLENGVSFYSLEREGKKIFVCSAVGHLFGLTYVKGQKGWPIFDIEWVPSYDRESASYTKKYFDLIKKLSRKAEEIIVATDFDVEGEVIGWNVLRFICKRENAKRMKFSTLTKDELENSYNNVLPELNWKNAYAGETRHILDWLYGINLSRALMSAIKSAGSFKILSVGRVQGPSLKIIVEKEREILAFKSETYWQVFALSNDCEFLHPKDIFKKEELEKFKNIKEAEAETIDSMENIPPQPPFDLTSLQREAYRVHRLSPSQTLSIAQKLYLDGLISYPRTSSQKIPFTINPKKILKSLEKRYPDVKQAVRDKPIEGKKTDPAHPSIYPTGEYKKLGEKDEKLYDLIVRKFISVFCQDAITENRKVTLNAVSPKTKEKIEFRSSGMKIKQKGWAGVYPVSLEEKEIPSLNGQVKIDEIKFVQKETQPPKRYSPSSLIGLLEKKNLGTKTTRSLIIDTLFDRGYIEGDSSLKATPLGMKLIESLEKFSPIIIDENLTRKLEDEMEGMQEETGAESSPEELEAKEKNVVSEAKKIITDISKDFRAHEIEIGKSILKGIETQREIQKENSRLMTCPKCKTNDLRILYSRKNGRSFIACSGYPQCTQTYSLPPQALIKKAEEDCLDCRFPKLISIKRGKRPWKFCFNPECPSNRERMEAYRAKKESGQ